MKLPDNKLKYPIEQLIEQLAKLPPGTTYEEEEPILFGGESPDLPLGTSYQLKINITEGFKPTRE